MSIQQNKYYHFEDDLQKYPEAWCYVVYSRRGPGKTYSALKHSYINHIPIIYMKRTNDDVRFICQKPETENDIDPSPYAPLNRDHNYGIYGRLLDEGLGGFWHYEDGSATGLPAAYCLSLNAVKRVKGFEASRCDWILFDEFIPQKGERLNRKEGELLLDLYMTINRDRELRGKEAIKLVLFANAEEISTPITNELEIIDNLADLNASGKTHLWIPERGIMIHHITNEEIPLQDSQKTGIYKAMEGTAWARKSFEGDFSSNDFSNVKPQSLKGYSGYIHVRHKLRDFYIYKNASGKYYMCSSRTKCPFEYDLNRENEQKLFYYEHQIDLWNACIEERMKFQSYSMYDLIVNYTKLFNVRR